MNAVGECGPFRGSFVLCSDYGGRNCRSNGARQRTCNAARFMGKRTHGAAQGVDKTALYFVDGLRRQVFKTEIERITRKAMGESIRVCHLYSMFTKSLVARPHSVV